ncbi:hypothetical protein BDY19DRAFT_992886 [Irpex rosettiformis]|uniref:Uncharacterized protein n=1 Tax=Irpex rosettiformis TaxID=378272 RepID=A0ACB8U6P7_9APHY|nr:hypothetical protein BDY19DRAFT_992886 [Irpex rosettiformis]
MRKLLAAREVWASEGDEFKHFGYVIAWEEDGKQYRVDHTDINFDLEQLKAPSPVQTEHLTTPWLDTCLEAPTTLSPSTTFIKLNSAIDFEPCRPTLLQERMRREIEAYMKLFRSPHPNICPFYGCVRDDSHRVSALALKHIPHRLPFVWGGTELPVSKLSILRGIRRGLDHLHSLGIVHNDINRTNISLDELFRPVIVDFGSARGEGEELGFGGIGRTSGWCRKSEFSLKENDIFGLGLTAKWLDGWEADPASQIESTEPCSWTEHYLAPKIIAIGATSSKLYSSILSGAFYMGARIALLNDDPLSTSFQVPPPLLNERFTFVSAHSRNEFVEAWTRAAEGLRSDETDVAFFPITSDILCEDSDELQQLEAMISSIPPNLRHRRMQPCLILFDTNSTIATRRDLRRLEVVLSTLVQDWDDTSDVFRNFALIQPGGWFSWNRLRVYLWQTSETAGSCFGTTPHFVRSDKLIDFVLEPPEVQQGVVWSGSVGALVRSVVRVDDLTLFTVVAAQAALTFYLFRNFV